LQSLLRAATGDAPLDLVVLNEAPPGLKARVVTTGLRLYCRDAEADHAFAATHSFVPRTWSRSSGAPA